MAFTYGFYNSLRGDRKYNAEQVSELFDGILKDGIIPSQGQLFAVSTANNGMQINVGTGRAWFNHTWSKNDSVMVLTVPQSDITRPRYDAVVLEIDHNDSVRANSIKIVQGTAATNPVKPTLVNNDKVHQYPLAWILVPAAAETITASNIENAVGLEPTVFATGVLESVSIDQLWAQWQGDWTTWFEGIKLQLSGDVVTNLQLQIDQRVKKADKATVADAQSGTNDTKWMTPATTKSAIDANKDSIKISGTEYSITYPDEITYSRLSQKTLPGVLYGLNNQAVNMLYNNYATIGNTKNYILLHSVRVETKKSSSGTGTSDVTYTDLVIVRKSDMYVKTIRNYGLTSTSCPWSDRDEFIALSNGKLVLYSVSYTGITQLKNCAMTRPAISVFSKKYVVGIDGVSNTAMSVVNLETFTEVISANTRKEMLYGSYFINDNEFICMTTDRIYDDNRGCQLKKFNCQTLQWTILQEPLKNTVLASAGLLAIFPSANACLYRFYNNSVSGSTWQYCLYSYANGSNQSFSMPSEFWWWDDYKSELIMEVKTTNSNGLNVFNGYRKYKIASNMTTTYTTINFDYNGIRLEKILPKIGYLISANYVKSIDNSGYNYLANNGRFIKFIILPYSFEKYIYLKLPNLYPDSVYSNTETGLRYGSVILYSDERCFIFETFGSSSSYSVLSLSKFTNHSMITEG